MSDSSVYQKYNAILERENTELKVKIADAKRKLREAEIQKEDDEKTIFLAMNEKDRLQADYDKLQESYLVTQSERDAYRSDRMQLEKELAELKANARDSETPCVMFPGTMGDCHDQD